MGATGASTAVPSPADSPQAWAVEVAPRPGMPDPAGDAARAALAAAGVACERVEAARVYTLRGRLDHAVVARIATDLLADPVAEMARWWAFADASPAADPSAVLVTKLPGVMDPVEASVARGIADLGFGAATVRTGLRYRFHGLPPSATPDAIVRQVLANPVVDEIRPGGVPRPPAADRPAPARPVTTVPLRDLPRAGLLAISKRGALSLDADEMLAIQAHFAAHGRDPTDLELETLAQTWSEHCKHKTLTSAIVWEGEAAPAYQNLLKDTIFDATRRLARDYCLSVFADNAGVIRFDETRGVAVKVETHNHPSAIEPYGGAGTGVGGVIRDVLGTGLGAAPILCTDTFGVAPPDWSGPLPGGGLHPRRTLRGVVRGVRDYGNRMGIPTAAGGLIVHEGYLGAPLVFAGCVGVLPVAAVTKDVRPGDHVVAVGGRTGRDGIHGATFSSAALDSGATDVNATAVQIGNAITERRVLEGVLRCRDAGYLRAITDCGAGGFSSAVGELGERCGADVELARVPCKYPGLSPAEIWISEAQERMVCVVPPEHLAAACAVLAEEECEATPIGRFTDSGRLVVRYDGAVVGDLPMAFLHGGLPRRPRTARRPEAAGPDVGRSPSRPVSGGGERRGPPPADVGDGTATLERLLADWAVCSREWIVRQYDHEVQGGTVVKPFVGPRADGPGDGCVVRPDPRSRRGVALAHGANPRIGEIDAYAMALAAVDEALRNLAAMGALTATVALLDNFVWGDTQDPAVLGALVRACEGCRDAALAYGAPFVSGKDSLHNVWVAPDGATHPVPPTLLVTALAVMDDVAQAVTSDCKRAGNELWLVGTTRDELGGSCLHASEGVAGGAAPRVDLARAPAVLRAIARATGRGLVRAAHDPSEGGLAVALAEMCIGGDLGAEVGLGAVPGAGALADWAALWSESPTRMCCEVEPGQAAAFRAALGDAPAARIGTVTGAPRLVVRGRDGRPVIDAALDRLRAAFRSRLYRVMGDPVPEGSA